MRILREIIDKILFRIQKEKEPPKEQGKYYHGIRIYYVILLQTKSNKALKALMSAGLTYEYSMKALEYVRNENIIVATAHYELAEHIASIIKTEDSSLRISIREV